MSRHLPVALAVAFVALAPAAHAIWMTPDIVDIPTERLVTNLEKKLAGAPPEERSGLLLQLARVHAAAYADKRRGTSVTNPIRWSAQVASIVGPHEDDEVRGPLELLYARNGSLFQMLRTVEPDDAKYGCVVGNLAGIYELEGKVTLSFEIPKDAGDAVGGDQMAATRVRVVGATLANKDVARCLRARIAQGAIFPVKFKKSTVRVQFTFDNSGPEMRLFAGFGEITVPEQVVDRPLSDDERARAQAHLVAARERYTQTIALAPDSALAKLGLAWTLQQEGRVGEAIARYRETFAQAWEKEGRLEWLGLGARPLAAEAATYLMPLLDKDKDAAEISVLDKALRHLTTLPRPVTPLVVPLADDATRLEAVVDPASVSGFDLDGSGAPRRWGWIRPNAAFIVWDPKGAGRVTSGLQMFGSVSFWLFWEDGYEALAALDDDGDGQLMGEELVGLALWHDVDGDAESDAGEVQTLAKWGITMLSVRGARGADGVLGASAGVRFADGTCRPTWDWTPTSGL